VDAYGQVTASAMWRRAMHARVCILRQRSEDSDNQFSR
jgi:hypothetical protein